MSLFDFAYRNIIRDKSSYLYYFLSCTLSVFVFFLFTVLSFHPNLDVVDTHSTMGIMLIIGELISALFSFCFILYSVHCFLKNRSRQFGLIIILGASKKQLNRLIFWENILVGIASIVSGILLGLVFEKFFLDTANYIIGISDFGYYFPLNAMLATFLMLGFVFFMVSVVAPGLIRHRRIVELFKAEIKAEKTPNVILPVTAFVLALSIVIFTISSHSDMAKKIANSSLFLLPVIISAVFGTRLLFTLINYILWRHKSSKCLGTALLESGNIREKNFSSIQSMTIAALLYAVSFFAVIILFSASRNVKAGTEAVMPYAMTYNRWTDSSAEDESGDIRTIENILDVYPGYREIFYKAIFVTDLTNSDKTVCALSVSDYNRIMDFLGRDKINVTDTEVYLVAGHAGKPPLTVDYTSAGIYSSLGIDVTVSGSAGKLIMLDGFFNEVHVMSDDNLSRIVHSGRGRNMNIYAFNYADWENNKQAVSQVEEAFMKEPDDNINIINAYDYYHTEKLQYDLTLYIGGMLCFTFLLAVASFIYSRLYSGLYKDCRLYRRIVKIGLSKKELTKVLTKEIFQIVILPFLLAVIYLWVGVLFFEGKGGASNISTAAVCTLALCIIQFVIFLWVKSSYRKEVFKNVYFEYYG